MPAIETAGTPRSFRLRSLTLVDPLLCCQRVLNQLFGTEEEINLKLSRFGAIGAMNDIVADLQSVIAGIVPGMASEAFVAPIVVRTTLMAFGPSTTPTTTGLDVICFTRPLKNGLPL